MRYRGLNEVFKKDLTPIELVSLLEEEEEQELPLPPYTQRGGHAGHREGGPLQGRKAALTRKQIYLLAPGSWTFPACRTVRKLIHLLFKLPSLWYFSMTGRTGLYTVSFILTSEAKKR